MNPDDCTPLGNAICVHLAEEIRKLGFPEENLSPFPVYDQAAFTQSKDVYSGQDSLIGTWKNGKGYRVGEIKLNGDGSFYAEFDVALPHPTNARWFVEAVIAWGRDDIIKAEAKLLPAFGL